jgi:uncharacterized damage-inducible protein DinB
MRRLFTLGTLGLMLAGPLAAQGAAAGPAPTGLRGDMLVQFDQAAGKVLQLAQAFPQEKYTWRPGAGVRSVSQVLLHLAASDYFLLSFAGVTAPPGTNETGDTTITARAQIIALLQRSHAHVRAAIAAAKDADMDKPVTMFGERTTMRNVYLTEVSHVHEHLGQLIAYARTNGIVPPWSMPPAR